MIETQGLPIRILSYLIESLYNFLLLVGLIAIYNRWGSDLGYGIAGTLAEITAQPCANGPCNPQASFAGIAVALFIGIALLTILRAKEAQPGVSQQTYDGAAQSHQEKKEQC